MKDLRDEMYASAMENENSALDHIMGDSRVVYKEYVTKSEFDRVVKMFERKIAMLEAKINNNGWADK